jgi:hypothetical protein
MEVMLLRIFQGQVALQCKFLLQSAQDLNAALKKMDTERIFYALQNLLNAGANISKSLWGQGGRLAQKRKPLRDSINIGDDSPLRQVTMRNNFEHFDERLERWWNESKRHNYADMNIGPKGGYIFGLETIDMFRLFDPNTTDLTFWGEEFNIQAIVTEAQNILPRLLKEASK